jgi:hypothetical protein
VQTVPHAPQWLTSVFSSTQAPLQAVNPAAHTKPHAELEQVAVPFAGAMQMVAQPPQ